MIEKLERRALLSVSVIDGIVQITGSDADNTYQIAIESDELLVTEGEVGYRFALSSISGIRADLGAGDDSLDMTGVAVPAFVFGAAGNDTIVGGSLRDTLYGGAGEDELRGGRGADLIQGGAGADIIVGGRGRDHLVGKDGADSIHGGDGNDLLQGGIGRDTLRGLAGNDTIYGGWGHDRLAGGVDDDLISGMRGNDTVHGGAGVDRLYGNDGDDLLYANDGTISDVVYGGNGQDRAWFDLNSMGPDGIFGVEFLNEDAQLQGMSQAQFIAMIADGAGEALSGKTVASNEGVFFLDGAAYAARSTVASDSTNTQEVGVDEADLMETDGRYFYWLTSGDGNHLRIIDPIAMQVVANVPLEQQPTGMYLRGSELTIISRRWASYSPSQGDAVLCRMVIAPTIDVLVFDVADPTAPVLKREWQLDAEIVSSRMTETGLHLVLRHSAVLPPMLYETSADGATITYESAESYRERIRAMGAGEVLGEYRTRIAGGDWRTGTLASDTIAADERFANPSLLTVATIANDGEIRRVSTAEQYAWGSTVYATADSVYVASNAYVSDEQRTLIQRIALGETGPQFASAGSVPGRLVGQFAMDEYNGVLRVATTSGWGQGVWNSLYMLRESDSTLHTVGELSGFGVGETIHGIRFTDRTAYIVTFRQTDPLHVIDLTDETNPLMSGELQIPGFSNYLHPISDTRVIGIGYDAASKVEMSLVDVSDPSQPVRVATTDLGGAYYASVAIHDHLAFNYFPELNLIAVPFSGDSSGTPEYGVAFVRVEDDGFAVVSKSDMYNSLRTALIGDVLCVGSSIGATFVSAGQPDEVLGEVTWDTEPEPGIGILDVFTV